MSNHTTTITRPAGLITWAKLGDGSWGIKGTNLVSGATVTVTKANGTTSEVVVGEVNKADKAGRYDFATVARTPRPAVATTPANTNKVTEEGFYLLDGQAYKVIEARSKDFFYARAVTSHGLEKAPGIYNRLTSEHKMTPEQIAAYGVRTRVCVNCSTALNDPASQRVGLGTKCGPAILGNEVYRAAYKAADAEVKAAKAKADADSAADKAQEVADLLAHFGL